MTPSSSPSGRGATGEPAEVSTPDGDRSDQPAPEAPPERRCLNCGAPLGGPYCGQCGQEDRREIPTIRALLRELVGDLFELDSRIWRTLRVLVARPGGLTLDYLAGRRRRYLPPFRLFVATGVAMLLVYSFSGDTPLRVGAATAVDGEEPGVVEGPANPSVDAGEGDLRARLLEAFRRRVRADPEGMQEAFGENLPRMMFLFLPLAAAMLALLYAGSGRRYVEHLVFSVHAHAFVFLELAVARSLRTWLVGPETVLGTGVALGVAVWTLVYFFLALRRVYGEGRLATSMKFVVLVAGYGLLLNLMLALTAVVTVLLA